MYNMNLTVENKRILKHNKDYQVITSFYIFYKGNPFAVYENANIKLKFEIIYIFTWTRKKKNESSVNNCFFLNEDNLDVNGLKIL